MTSRRGRGLLGVLLAACAGSSPDVDDTDDTYVVAPPPPLPVVPCGGATWARLDGPLGELLDAEPRPDLSLSSTALDLVFGAAGLAALSPTPHDVLVHRIRYTTQDRGVQVEATGLVAVPSGDVPDAPWPVVLLLHSFSGLQGPCSPSAGRLEEAIEAVLVASRGFVVIAPDDIGLDGTASPPSPHAPLVAEQLAVGAWDALRAGRTLLDDPRLAPYLPRGTRDDVVLWGYSQGGHGALAAERLGAYLAPDEHVAAVIAGVPPLDVRAAVAHALEGWSDGTGLAALAVVGMHRWYRPDAPLSTAIADAAPDYLATRIQAAYGAPSETCDGGLEVDADSVDDLFAPGFVTAGLAGDWDAVAPFDCFLAEASLPWMSIPALRWTPTLLVFGTDDTVVDLDAQQPGVAALCDAGARMATLACDGGDHAYAGLWSIPEQEAFVRDRLAGVPFDGCAPAGAPVRCAATGDAP